MGFDYDKIKSESESGSHWASYSDLFMVLSLVFLLLYVVSSMRNGTYGIQKSLEYQQIVREKDDLKQQIKVYSTLKDNYLQTGATQDEQQVYNELMNKLELLQGEAKKEKEDLRAQANENAKKEKALNKYQQMVRNIINTNMLSAARIKRRDRVIITKDKDIKAKKQEIKSLEKTVSQKEKEVKKGEWKISKLNSKLQNNISKLQKEFEQKKISKKKMQAQIAKLKKRNQSKISKLKKQNLKIVEELQETSQTLQVASSQLSEAQTLIESQSSEIQALASDKAKFNEEIKSLKTEFDSKQKSERKRFLAKLKKQKLTLQERQKQEAEYKQKVESQKEELSRKISSMNDKVKDTQSALDVALKQKSKAESSLKKTKQSEKTLKGKLKRAQEIANAKKKLIKNIKENLKKSGIKAEVDGKTGDVLISFGEEYFDTGKAKLKTGMKSTLEKFMPLYSESLFSDSKTAKEISSVEIIGYASPTYKGKFVDPVSLRAENREAVNYNLDLSYYRARSIFDYIFDTNKMKYKHQKSLLPRVKVTGRSFLSEGSERGIASGMSHKEYCKKYDCKKSQRVIIRFNMGR